MNVSELNEYVKNYVINNKTNRALMLSAEWGVGKTYYVNNNLIPYLKKSNIECVSISAYGMKDIIDISKSIYFEIRFKNNKKSSEKKQIAKIIGKTIAKNVIGHIGIDLSVSEKDLEKLYNSIDLSNKLLIIDDFERSKMDALNIMGFVNNLVEHDGIKVLIVSNENELLNNNDYKRVKEKTIGDTIRFDLSVYDAVDNIINDFFSVAEDSKKAIVKIIVDEIMLNNDVNNKNLRLLMYGCQKAMEINNICGSELKFDFFKMVLYGIIAYSLKFNFDSAKKWKEKGLTSNELGTFKYPLYRFCYDYIQDQMLDIEQLKEIQKDYFKHVEFENRKTLASSYLDVIHCFWNYNDDEVIEALNNIYATIDDQTVIPVTEYVNLANYLIPIKNLLGKDELVNDCKEKMLNNAKKANCDLLESALRSYGLSFDNKKDLDEYNDFRKDIVTIIESKKKDVIEFDYSREGLKTFLDDLNKNKDKYIIGKSFSEKINNDKLIELISICSSREINEIRSTFNNIYSYGNINSLLPNDKDSLVELREKLNNLLSKNAFDKIKNKQISWFSDNIDDIIKRLEQ